MSKQAFQDAFEKGTLWRGKEPPRVLHTQQEQGLDSGFVALNAALAEQGWPVDAVSEIHFQQPGQGELSMLLPLLKARSQIAKWIILVAPPYKLHAPALEAAGVNIERLLLIHPRSEKERLWCTEEALKSGAASLVLSWPGSVKPEQVRRLQIMAGQAQSPCILFRQNDEGPTPCALRLRVEGRDAEHSAVHVLKKRGGWQSRPITLQIRQCQPFRYGTALPFTCKVAANKRVDLHPSQ